MTDATFEVETNPQENSDAAMIKRTMGLRGIVFLLMMVWSDHTRRPERPDRPWSRNALSAPEGAWCWHSWFCSFVRSRNHVVFVTRHVKLNAKVCLFYLGLFLAGVGFILGSVFISQYGGAWTFLFPLPAISGGAWELGAAVAFCVGYLLIWVGFLIY